jgi:ribosomal protein L44E
MCHNLKFKTPNHFAIQLNKVHTKKIEIEFKCSVCGCSIDDYKIVSKHFPETDDIRDDISFEFHEKMQLE